MNKKTVFLLLTLLVSVIIGAHLLFKPITDAPPPIDNYGVSQNIISNETLHQKTLIAFANKNKNLQAQLQQTKVQVSKANLRVKKLQQQAKVFIATTNMDSLSVADTSPQLALCDSLQQNVLDLISTSNYKDSIVGEQVMVYENLLSSQDSTIKTLQDEYNCLQSQTDTLINCNQQITQLLKTSARKTKIAKVEHRFITGTLTLLVSVFALSQFSNRN